MTTRDHDISLREFRRAWAYIAVNSFGGPAGQIAVMHREIVDRRRWVSESRFLHALNYCMVLPGPEAQQLATYLGWLLHGVRGGILAGALFVIPGAIVMLALSIAYALFGDVTWVAGLFAGLQAAVVVLVIHAFLRISGRALTDRRQRLLALAAFVLITVTSMPFPVIVIGAGLLGWAWGRRRDPAPQFEEEEANARLADHALMTRGQARTSFRAAVVFAALWVAPVITLVLWLGTGHVFTQEALLFSKAAVVTFGGAYAVLGYVAQEAVGKYQWVNSSQLATGLGLAETTPGPLILVLQFIGFLAAYQHPGSLPPLAAGVIGSVIALWVTFIPCFLFIFAGAPFAERLRGNRHLATALRAITAAVAGVIASLALWFAMHTLFASTAQPQWGPFGLTVPVVDSIRWSQVGIAVIAAILLFRFRIGTMRILAACMILGAVVAIITSSAG